jgi:putative peptide zinc metalloprotease protein
MSESAPERLLPLRQELTLHQAPPAPDGSPQWTLADPVTHNFYRLGWNEFALLAHWGPAHNAESLCAAAANAHGLQLGVEDVASLQRFLLQNELLDVSRAAYTRHLHERHRARRHGRWRALAQSYLFLRIPLCRPDRFLEATLGFARLLASPLARRMLVLSTLLGIYLVMRQWDAFVGTFMDMLTPGGLLAYAVTLVGVKIAHEFGHAWTAKHHGLSVPSMGVALLVMWPVLYTDTTDAWKLPSRRARLSVTGAGMITELALAGVATLLWSFLPDGPLRSAAFLVASVTWVMTLAVNLNPFMRFDGYYLLSDWLEIPNLQERSFALTRWWLRRKLPGIDAAPPEHLPQRTVQLLIGYGLATWTYRLLLFVSIALLLYHTIFAPLGPLLAAVEILWFIALPVWRELRHWWDQRQDARWRRTNALASTGVAALVLLLLLPWSLPLQRTGLLRPAEYAAVHAPEAAQLQELLVSEGEAVAQGQLLLRLDSPELDFALAQAETDVATHGWRLERSRTVREMLDFGPAAEERYAEALARRHSIAQRIATLELRAPIAGRVVELDQALAQGRWLTPGMALMTVVGDQQLMIETYVEERDRAMLAAGQTARFHPENASLDVLDAVVVQLDGAPAASVREAWFADRYAGDVPTRVDAGGSTLQSAVPIYRVLLQAEAQSAPLQRLTRGTVVLPGERSSMLLHGLRRVAAVLRRETGL